MLALFMDAAGKLWAGTNGGLSRLDGERFTSFTAASGLPSDSVTQLTDDEAGDLWLGSSRGVSRVSKAALEQAAHPERRLSAVTFDRADGLRSSQCTAPGQPAGIRARDGRLWFATTQGIVVVDVQRLRRHVDAPPVAMEDVLLDGHSVAAGAELAVPPGTARLEFRYTGVALLAPSRVTFRYRLDGFDEDWVESLERAAQYTSLRPGSYAFHVSARLGDGPWNPSPAVVALRVLPHFHQTWAFLAMVAVALVGLLGGGHRLRIRQLEASRRELAALVGERTRSLAEEAQQAERLLAATQALGSTLDLTSILALILAELQRVVPYDSASVQELLASEPHEGPHRPKISATARPRKSKIRSRDRATKTRLAHPPTGPSGIS